ncbi:MAG: pilin [Patescibacteria group bacterium]|jgi:Zn-dependent protease with chaperone function
MKNISKHLISLAILAFLVVPAFALTAHAQFDPGLNAVSNGLNNSLSSTDPRTVIGRIINMALGFLGVIAVGIVLLGGFKWMTAGGNEEKTGEAKKLLGAGVIGLVIILSSWAIATFIINSLMNAVN